MNVNSPSPFPSSSPALASNSLHASAWKSSEDGFETAETRTAGSVVVWMGWASVSDRLKDHAVEDAEKGNED